MEVEIMDKDEEIQPDRQVRKMDKQIQIYRQTQTHSE